MSAAAFLDLPRRRRADPQAGIASVCSAHPLVIEAALRHGLRLGRYVLIEATCNQVNQEGGYTGLDPACFRDFCAQIAERVGFPAERLVLGGDHLGPNPWTSLPPELAMGRAEAMVEAYAAAGFAKIHLDTSMPCAGDPAVLGDDVVADRAARLAAAAERAAAVSGLPPPVFVIGTEVPPPGGAGDDMNHIAVTRPEAARHTITVHREAFARHGLAHLSGRIVAAVVQPGVEFGNESVAVYDPQAATGLAAVLRDEPSLVFEAHSTDYQPPEALASLVRDGFAILKVGPWLTFALREALYGLDAVASFLVPGRRSLAAAMEEVMLAHPESWAKHYHGDTERVRILRHFSYSDRIRYVWQDERAARAVADLMAILGSGPLPAPLVAQYLPALLPAYEAGSCSARDLLLASVESVLDRYAEATR